MKKQLSQKLMVIALGLVVVLLAGCGSGASDTAKNHETVVRAQTLTPSGYMYYDWANRIFSLHLFLTPTIQGLEESGYAYKDVAAAKFIAGDTNFVARFGLNGERATELSVDAQDIPQRQIIKVVLVMQDGKEVAVKLQAVDFNAKSVLMSYRAIEEGFIYNL